MGIRDGFKPYDLYLWHWNVKRTPRGRYHANLLFIRILRINGITLPLGCEIENLAVGICGTAKINCCCLKVPFTTPEAVRITGVWSLESFKAFCTNHNLLIEYLSE